MKHDIYVHVPKTAGVTLKGLLIDKFGPENVWGNDVRSGRLASMERQGFKADNSQRAGREKLGELVPAVIAQAAAAAREKLIFEDPEEALPKARIVIGHFPVTAYDDIPAAGEADYFTVVRDPMARMQSHYKYLNQLSKLLPKMRHWGENHHVDQPFADFAFDPQLQNYQTQFTGADLGRYALVGVHEQLPVFLRRNGLLSDGIEPQYLNKTEWAGPLAGVNDPGFVRDFQEYHALDYELYGQALANNG